MSACANRQPVDYGRVADLALFQAQHLLAKWFPAGRLRGHGFCIGNLHGDPGEILRVNLRTLGTQFRHRHLRTDAVPVVKADRKAGRDLRPR